MMIANAANCYNVAEELVNLLWNIHQYYKQFAPKVTDHLTKQRKPIDKELQVGTYLLNAIINSAQ